MMNTARQISHPVILICTVTKVEGRAVIDAFETATHQKSKPVPFDERIYRDLGVINGSHIFMATSEMGSGGIGGSQEEVRRGIEALKPSAVIMVGIAFGINENKQAIGEILVSKQILLYELQRKSKDQTISRGDKAHAAVRLINWLYHAEFDWPDSTCKVDFGLILSGAKLVDDIDYRAELHKFASEAIGGEMEGEGLYVAAQNANVDWILVKAICDWADGNKGHNKSENQKLAAKNAAAFVLHAIQTIPLLANPNLVSKDKTQTIAQSVQSLTQNLATQDAKIASIQEDLAQGRSQLPPFVPHVAGHLVNQEIEKELNKLIQARFIYGFSRVEFATALGERIQSGDLRGGSNHIRSRALAWCARVLGGDEQQKQSDVYLELAKSLENNDEVVIATAFSIAAHGDVDEAISKLAKIPSPFARSAAFFIQTKHQSAAVAVEWLAAAGLTQDDLDPDGKYSYLVSLLTLAKWDVAFECASSLKEVDFQLTPALLLQTAMAFLLCTVTEECRVAVAQQLPFDAKRFPLASDNDSLELRRKATELFTRCSIVARELSCVDTANFCDDYALWLKLRDPLTHNSTIEVLKSSMSKPADALRRVPLALQFDLPVDIEAIERQISHETALTGGTSPNAALARLALALRIEDPKTTTDYIDRHRTQLFKHLNKKMIQRIEVEALLRAGLQNQAESLLREMIADGFSGSELKRLQLVVSNIQGQDQTEQLKAMFAESDSFNDLNLLIELLKKKRDWQQLNIYAATMFDRTKDVADAELLAESLKHTHRLEDIGALLRQFPELPDQSDQLQAHWCETLYIEGELTECATELKKLRAKRDHPADRQFEAELAITSGNWEELLQIAEVEWRQRERRSAEELIRAAYAAQLAGSPRARDLMYAAAEKGSADPNILSAAYSLATNANWEDDPAVFEWMQTAMALSSEEGPVRKMSLQDLIEMKPNWDLRAKNASEKVLEGVMPLFGVANLLNQSLVSMMLIPSLTNLTESDVRRRRVIPSYSGARQSTKVSVEVIAIEATVLLNLAQLDLLGQLEETFRQIVIPHTTLKWLYNEKKKAPYHQPSRIKNAHELKRLLANGTIQCFNATLAINADLASEIGEDLAEFLTEVQIIDTEGNTETNKFVIVSQPVYQITSLMQQEADLSAYSAHLCSSMAIVKKLQEKGQLRASEVEQAQAYIKRQEQDWPNQPDLPDGAVLFLDNATVSHLQYTKLIGKLKAAGLTAYISKSEIKEIDELINYDVLSNEISEIIEKIRLFLMAGMKSGKIKLTPMPNENDDSKKYTDHSEMGYHPTMMVFRPGEHADAIIVDDRAMNRHVFLELESKKNIPISTTLDLLNTFVACGKISNNQLYEAKTKLRQAGYLFIDLTVAELQSYLGDAQLREEKILENAELRAIRENFLLIKMSDFLQLPGEALWFHLITKTFTDTLKAQWHSGITEIISRARSDWLLSFLDSRGWAHSLKINSGLSMVDICFGANVAILSMAGLNMTKTVRGKYYAWLESALLVPLKQNNPDLWLKIVAQMKTHISNLTTQDEAPKNE